MPTSERPRGGIAAATAFYGNKAAGAASAGIKHRKKEARQSMAGGSAQGTPDGLPPRARSTSDLEVGFKSPRSVALWKQRKLEMAGMVTVVNRWVDTKKPWEKTVTTPAPIQRRDFTKTTPYEIQRFEQWHDRHPHLDYPREIPDKMFYQKKGKGPLPAPNDKGVPTARAYGGKHVKKLPGLILPKSGRKENSYSLSNASPQPLCTTAFLNAMFQDVGAGDGSWRYANPRALRWIPYELLRTGNQWYYLTSTLTNLHFLLRKAQECGVAAVRYDLQQAEKAFKSLFRSGKSFEQGVSMDTLFDWQARMISYRQFIDQNIVEIAALPADIFRLGATTLAGSHVHNDVQTAVMQAEHAIGVIHALLDPLQSSDADAVNNIPRLLSARQFLEIVRNHGIWLAMDITALDRIATAEKRAEEHIQSFRERLQEVPEAIDRVGQVLLRGPAGLSEHWEKDSSFLSLAELFGEDFFDYEPHQAFACFSIVQTKATSQLLLQLAEDTGLPQDLLELSVNGNQASLKITMPSKDEDDTFKGPSARAVAQRIMHDACDADSDLRQGGLVFGGPQPPTFWQEACIYISSTLADMQPERDMLSRFVLPALKLACRRRRLRLSWVMCGVDAPADLSKNLSWVQKSTLSLPDGKVVPFSLAILGSKLGWIPGQDVRVESVRRSPEFSWLLEEPFCKWSLNHLEICQAQLHTKDSRGFIFMRDASFQHTEAFQQSPLQVQEIFQDNSNEARELDEEFKMYMYNQSRLFSKCEGGIFDYKTVFVDAEVQESTSPGVRVAFAGLFSFGLDVYSTLYKLIDSVHPTCASSQPELSSVTLETETARERQLQLHALSVVDGTRTHFISQLCDLVFESQDDILVAVNGPPGCGRTGIMAQIIQRTRLEQQRIKEHMRPRAGSRSPLRGTPASIPHHVNDNFEFVWVIHEPWHTECDWLHCIASQVCRRAAGVDSDEYVGEVSMQSITNVLWDMITHGVSIVIVIDGLSYEEQFEIGRMFNTLQGRSNAEWFGNEEKKRELGRLKIVVSTHGFNSQMHRRVRIMDVPQLELEERLRICYTYIVNNKCQIPTKVIERMCGSKIGAAHPRYLKVALDFLASCQKVFPGQMDAIIKDLSPHLDTMYQNDVIPFLESLGDASGIKTLLSALVNCKGLLPCEIKWVLQEAGQPGDDGRVHSLVDQIETYVSAHNRADHLLCLGCDVLRKCVARRYNLEIKEVPLLEPEKAAQLAKAEAAAKNRLVHRRLLAAMERKAGFSLQPSQSTGQVMAPMAPTAITQDSARDNMVDDRTSQVIDAAIYDAQQDCFADLLVARGRQASLSTNAV